MTAKELIEHLKKFKEDALIQLITEEGAYILKVDNDAPFDDEEFRSEVCLFIDNKD